MQVKEIIDIVVEMAQKYQKNLENKNILFVYLNRINKKIEYTETKFLSRNFLHLTGLFFLKKQSNYFYKLCINHKLKSNDIQIKNKRTLLMKLEVLNNLIALDKKTKILGIFNHSKEKLHTELIIGNINWCLGLVEENGYYVPNSLLKEDIRNMVIVPHRIVCIMAKNIKDNKYKDIRYLANGFGMEDMSDIVSQGINASV